MTENDASSPRLWFLGAVVAAAAVLILARVLQRRFAEALALDYVTELRLALMSHVMRIPADARQPSSGLVMTRVVNDLSAIKLWIASGLVSITVAIATLVAMSLMLAAYRPALAIVLAIAAAIWCVPVLVSLKPLERHIRESRRQRGRIAARAGAILAARLTLLGFGRHGPTVRGLQRKSEQLNNALVGRATVSGLLRSSGDLVFPVVVLSAVIGRLFFETGAFDAVSLGVLVLMAGLTATHLSAVALGLEYRLAHKVALARLTSVMEVPALDLEKGQELARRDGDGTIAVKSLRLDPDGRSVTMTAEPGEAVALEGLSVEEATDFVLKLSRLKEPAAETVFLGGRDATTVRTRNWWRNVTVVSPQLPLIKANILKNGQIGAHSSISATERSRVLQRFGLLPMHMAMVVREGAHHPGIPAVAIRAARAVLRRSAVVLVADDDLVAEETLFRVFVEELQSTNATIVVATPLSARLRRGFRAIDLGNTNARAA
ncbi:ABC transporter transmembrane domain-containing protein [Hoeflea sp.]|uniref:ABC transporter transmembrane domain-containing protein n=1 Tax=Hoeflea sp. TaxID=1940281 RepID=UPI003B0197F1